MIRLSSPNCDSRGDAMIDMLVLHYTGMHSGEEAIQRLCDAQAKVSAHYVVEEEGRIFSLVDEASRAWHAGISEWRGRGNVNAHSIGIEIVNPGHEFGYRAFPNAQMEAVIALCKDILSRHPIPARNVVAHSDIAPARKEDPGELFDWEWLAREGVGLWPHEKRWRCEDVAQEKAVSLSHHHIATPSYPLSLSTYGYPLGDSSPEAIRKTILAFQRHFRPQKLTGIWDAECEARLAALLALADKGL